MKSGRKVQQSSAVLLTGLTLDLSQAMAQTAQAPEGLSETASLVSAIFKVLGSLALVIILMVGLVYLIKKAGLNQGLKGSSLIEVLDTKMVAPKKYIAIVDIGGKTVSLGITDHNITMLTELDQDMVRAELDKEPGAAQGATGSFSSILAKTSEWRRKKANRSHQEAENG